MENVFGKIYGNFDENLRKLQKLLRKLQKLLRKLQQLLKKLQKLLSKLPVSYPETDELWRIPTRKVTGPGQIQRIPMEPAAAIHRTSTFLEFARISSGHSAIASPRFFLRRSFHRPVPPKRLFSSPVAQVDADSPGDVYRAPAINNRLEI